MRRNILVEGMDGSGKDTLIGQLCELYQHSVTVHPRFSTSLGGPIAQGDELAYLVADDALNMPLVEKLTLYNRHPIISEPIYCGLRKGPVGMWASTSWLDSYRRFLGRYSAVVLCMPSFETVEANLLKNPEGQMAGVLENARELYDAYAALHWPGPIIRYDYNRDTPHTLVHLLGKVLN